MAPRRIPWHWAHPATPPTSGKSPSTVLRDEKGQGKAAPVNEVIICSIPKRPRRLRETPINSLLQKGLCRVTVDSPIVGGGKRSWGNVACIGGKDKLKYSVSEMEKEKKCFWNRHMHKADVTPKGANNTKPNPKPKAKTKPKIGLPGTIQTQPKGARSPVNGIDLINGTGLANITHFPHEAFLRGRSRRGLPFIPERPQGTGDDAHTPEYGLNQTALGSAHLVQAHIPTVESLPGGGYDMGSSGGGNGMNHTRNATSTFDVGVRNSNTTTSTIVIVAILIVAMLGAMVAWMARDFYRKYKAGEVQQGFHSLGRALRRMAAALAGALLYCFTEQAWRNGWQRAGRFFSGGENGNHLWRAACPRCLRDGGRRGGGGGGGDSGKKDGAACNGADGYVSAPPLHLGIGGGGLGLPHGAGPTVNGNGHANANGKGRLGRANGRVVVVVGGMREARLGGGVSGLAARGPTTMRASSSTAAPSCLSRFSSPPPRHTAAVTHHTNGGNFHGISPLVAARLADAALAGRGRRSGIVAADGADGGGGGKDGLKQGGPRFSEVEYNGGSSGKGNKRDSGVGPLNDPRPGSRASNLSAVVPDFLEDARPWLTWASSSAENDTAGANTGTDPNSGGGKRSSGKEGKRLSAGKRLSQLLRSDRPKRQSGV